MREPTPSPRLARWLSDYESCHRSAGNRFLHALGIPAVLVATLGLTGCINLPVPGMDVAQLTVLAALCWCLRLDWRLVTPLAALGAAAYLLGGIIPPVALWALMGVGWVLLYVGHLHFERNQPALHRNLGHLLIGPLWMLTSWLRWERPRAD